MRFRVRQIFPVGLNGRFGCHGFVEAGDRVGDAAQVEHGRAQQRLGMSVGRIGNHCLGGVARGAFLVAHALPDLSPTFA